MISSDAFYADDLETRHSSQDYDFTLFNDLIDWKASKQKTVIISITETELLTLSYIDKELIWWDRFFEQISFQLPHISHIECDNMQIIRVLINLSSQYTIKLRHVDVHRYWLRQKTRVERINIRWISTAAILANDFIKTLFSQRHKEFLHLTDLQKINNYVDEWYSASYEWYESTKGVCKKIEVRTV